ncbi:MAG TPA: patatin-like phospholipase family protein [Candidatus Coprenecus stercoravium]|uniref:Patatin-like phospholipase family protein n=1 Tax=Candidatus Coprenecus stercoravium TaxID=2840735 RepID=A0A9D2GQE6_9BACT|nr:patatin-like phospholipase family protein [Candidatus Coprenecus stercoravium]
MLLFVLLSAPRLSGQSVGLVLSGGGAKGLSHIGVIKALEDNGIPIDYISGTSIGSIVGGLYAIGLSPDDMIAMMKTKEFQAWYTGAGEREFFSYLYYGYPTPSMVRINMRWDEKELKQGRKKVKISLPASLVSPFPMDIAFVQMFANASAAAQYDFDNLMIPFFCVSADVMQKRPYISDNGDLGSAIRASMTFPAYFKPIKIDSVLLFDGGFYNNFPWEIMRDKYHPDVIIGAKCVKGEPIGADQDDLYKQLETIMTVDTDYEIPEEEGILISGIYDYSLLEFDKIDELVRKGYDTAMLYMDSILKRIERRRSAAQVDSMRIAFRQRCMDLKFDSLEVTGNLTDDQKEYIARTITDRKDVFSYNQAKRGYYRVLSTNAIQSFYPTARQDGDSLFVLRLQATPKNVLSLSVGGNISSSSLMQGYVGLSHVHFSRHPWNAAVNLDIGQLFTGVGLYFRQHIGVKPLFLYEVMINAQRYDYFGSSQGKLLSNSLASNRRETEYYATVNMGTPLSYNSSILLEFGITGGINKYDYFPADNYTQYDVRDNTWLSYLTARLKMAQSTLDYVMYPSSGRRRLLEFRYIFSHESHDEGTMFVDMSRVTRPLKHTLMVRLNLEDYYDLGRWFSLGYNLDITASTKLDLVDYTSTMMAMPAFQPTVHSKTLMLEAYRAPVYAGLTVSPIIKFTKTVFLHLTAGYFQPYRSLVETASGGYEYSDPFPKGGFIGNAAFVWQSPIGPVSLSCAYYEMARKTKWYPSFNIGFLIFREHGLRN